MRCSRMTLTDRRCSSRKFNRHVCRKYLEQGVNKFAYAEKCRSPSYCKATGMSSAEEQAHLTILNLMLPPDVETLAYNSGQNLERWSKKRSLLRSATTKKSAKADTAAGNGRSLSRERTESPDKDLTPGATITNIIAGSFGESSDNSCASSCHSEEIDPDIRKLLCGHWDENANVGSSGYGGECRSPRVTYADEDEYVKKKRKARRKRYEKKCNSLNEIDGKLSDNANVAVDKHKTKKKRTITISLSKPPSPETTQIIRVDVTSNLSIDDDFPETPRRRVEAPVQQSAVDAPVLEQTQLKAKGKKDDFKFAVPCQKLALSNRY